MLEIGWLGDSLDVVRGYSEDVRGAIGSELRLLQKGERPVHARPLKTVGRGVWGAEDKRGRRAVQSGLRREAK